MNNKYFTPCAECDGATVGALECDNCEDKGFVLTQEGTELIEFLEKMKLI